MKLINIGAEVKLNTEEFSRIILLSILFKKEKRKLTGFLICFNVNIIYS